jgi:hypothetical protein
MDYFKIQHFVLATNFLIEVDRAELRGRNEIFEVSGISLCLYQMFRGEFLHKRCKIENVC